MAKALKCDRCGAFFDYIKCLRKYQIHDMDERNFNKTIDLCPDCYAKLLSFLFLDEIKKGHWVALENKFGLGSRVKCSECEQVFVTGDSVSRNYCPNCGAKMVEPQESED